MLKIKCAPGNEVDVTHLAAGKGSVVVEGVGNRVSFGNRSRFVGTVNVVGENITVTFGAYTKIRGKILAKGKGQKITIGARTTFESVFLNSGESCDITIGKKCMFSREIEVRTTDAHSVIDCVTRKRLNPPGHVIVGDHVWIGLGVLVNKASIPSDCIVGAKSFVNRRFTESNVVIAGVPAAVVKRGITWNLKRQEIFSQKQMDAWKSL